MGAKTNRAQSDLRPQYAPHRRCQPFRDAEEAWFWTMAALMARREGAAIPPTRAASYGPASRTTW